MDSIISAIVKTFIHILYSYNMYVNILLNIIKCNINIHFFPIIDDDLEGSLIGIHADTG